MKLKLTPAELATRVGVSRQAILKWESEDGIKIGADNLHKLASALGVSQSQLRTGKHSQTDIDMLRQLGRQQSILDGSESDAEVLSLMEPRLVYLSQMHPAQDGARPPTDLELMRQLTDFLKEVNDQVGEGTVASARWRRRMADAMATITDDIGLTRKKIEATG